MPLDLPEIREDTNKPMQQDFHDLLDQCLPPGTDRSAFWSNYHSKVPASADGLPKQAPSHWAVTSRANAPSG